MMHGLNWLRFNGCNFRFGSGYFGIWHYLILIGIVLIIIALITRRKHQSSSNNDAVEKLKMLYVNGELSEEEYLKRKNVVEGK